jgi:hypothetical protein
MCCFEIRKLRRGAAHSPMERRMTKDTPVIAGTMFTTTSTSV